MVPVYRVGLSPRNGPHKWRKHTHCVEDALASDFTGDLSSNNVLREMVAGLVEDVLESLKELSVRTEQPPRK